MNPKDALESLVLALDATSWSSWQTTARFSVQHEAARKVLEQERIRDAAPDLLAIVQTISKLLDDGAPSALILDENSPTRDAIRDVLAKATGGES